MQITREQFFNFAKQRPGEDYQNINTWLSSTKYYVKLWDKHHESTWFISWNWGAFIFNYNWFLYRKMFSWAFLFTLLWIVTFSLSFSFIFYFYFIFISPLIANSLYLNYAKKHISRGKLSSGTSLVSVGWITVICIAVDIILSYI